jgi:hypothetical protein
VREIDDRLHNGSTLLALTDVQNKGSIDLDRVEREAAISDAKSFLTHARLLDICHSPRQLDRQLDR